MGQKTNIALIFILTMVLAFIVAGFISNNYTVHVLSLIAGGIFIIVGLGYAIILINDIQQKLLLEKFNKSSGSEFQSFLGDPLRLK